MSKEIYDQLVKSGAPRLPKGYFYRITTPDWDGMGRVELRKRDFFGPIHLVSADVGYPVDSSFILHEYAKTAARIFKLWSKASLARQFDGDHP